MLSTSTEIIGAYYGTLCTRPRARVIKSRLLEINPRGHRACKVLRTYYYREQLWYVTIVTVYYYSGYTFHSIIKYCQNRIVFRLSYCHVILFLLHVQLLLVLYEHAAGYALFRCQNVEEIGALLPEVQEAVLDFARFSQVAQLEAFSPFKTGANALDNINSISEGVESAHTVCNF